LRVDVFDPEMCCSTGVCGPAPDEALIRVEEALERLRQSGVEVARHQLSRDPESFLSHGDVYKTILSDGIGALPMVAVNGKLRFKGRYPTYDELCEALNVTT